MVTLQFVNQLAKVIKDIDIYNIQSLTWDDISSNFSLDLLDYIVEREVIRNKEKQEQASNMVRRHCSNSFVTSFDISADWNNLYTSCVRPNTVLNNPRTETQRTRYNRIELNDMDFEEMDIEQIEWKMKFINEDMRRANTMEKQMLQRELQKYANRLGQLRRNRH
jgi:hypothetical protein